jgi:hypothetical protein
MPQSLLALTHPPDFDLGFMQLCRFLMVFKMHGFHGFL